MSVLTGAGIIGLEDTAIYVAAKELFPTAEEFLIGVLSHIEELVTNYSQGECGWFVVPKFAKHINRVSISWMVHRINSEWHDAPFWEHIEEPGRGHKPVWYIDFEDYPNSQRRGN